MGGEPWGYPRPIALYLSPNGCRQWGMTTHSKSLLILASWPAESGWSRNFSPHAQAGVSLWHPSCLALEQGFQPLPKVGWRSQSQSDNSSPVMLCGVLGSPRAFSLPQVPGQSCCGLMLHFCLVSLVLLCTHGHSSYPTTFLLFACCFLTFQAGSDPKLVSGILMMGCPVRLSMWNWERHKGWFMWEVDWYRNKQRRISLSRLGEAQTTVLLLRL